MKILIIEDEYKLLQVLKKGLEQEQFIVDTAIDGTEGYDLAFEGNYDLIILDVMLPSISGIEICKKLRHDKIKTPILMLTAKVELEDKLKGLNNGADDYLTKPFAFEELVARIKALLRRPQESFQDSILVCDDLVMDTSAYTVSRGGNAINLSKKEYSLLEYLLRNQNKIISKDQIAMHVWNYDTDILPNTIEQYITYLRNKIDNPFKDKKHLIHTVRGFGYTLKAKESSTNV